MALCENCGANLADGAAFCQQCGNQQFTASAAPSTSSSGLGEKVASALCYLCGWITGFLFLFIDRRPAVRFHAAQCIVVFGNLFLLRIVLGLIFGLGWRGGAWSGFAPWGFAEWLYSLLQIAAVEDLLSFEAWGFSGLCFAAMGLLTFVLWIWLMTSSIRGKTLRVPLAAVIADHIAAR